MAISSRLMALSQSKQVHSKYNPPRDSPVWTVPKGALKAQCTPRLLSLSISKKCHPLFVGSKPVQSQVPLSARNVKPSPRTLVLAAPLPRKVTCKLEEYQKRKLYEIKHASITSAMYPRLEKLAISKSLHPSFIPNQPIQRLISKATLSAIPSQRVVELSTPLSRKMIKNTFNPYQVNPATQNVVPTDRILELAKPKKNFL